MTLAFPEVAPPAIQAQSAVLMEAETGLVLFALDPERPEPPASLAKVMTVDLALEDLEAGRIALADEVPVSEKAWRLAKDPTLSRMFIEPGLPVTVDQLLYGIMVSSGNDAAVALAEYLGHGSEDAFVTRMNERAQELGMRGTRFADAAGLGPGGETTALDMARLARHAILAHPEILAYSRTKEYRYNIATPQPNYNALLFRDPRVDGLKTGNIGGLFHLVATGIADGTRLIAVVMGTSSERARADQAEALLDWGFRSFAAEVAEGRVALPVYKGASPRATASYRVAYVAPRDLEAAGLRVTTARELPDYLVAPVERGQVVGTATVQVGDQAFRGEIRADQAVERGGFFRVVWDSLRLVLRRLVHLGR
ncbi:MAG: D-alanyl-D-alanine carboxypeptidase [Clostridia bacterium]|nr:D-alanyl-D-alanine carboxypeptidase [Clostridia bacterium]